MCNVGGTIADVRETENPMGIFSGTIICGWIDQLPGWRWIYSRVPFFVGGMFLFTLVMLETLASFAQEGSRKVEEADWGPNVLAR